MKGVKKIKRSIVSNEQNRVLKNLKKQKQKQTQTQTQTQTPKTTNIRSDVLILSIDHLFDSSRFEQVCFDSRLRLVSISKHMTNDEKIVECISPILSWISQQSLRADVFEAVNISFNLTELSEIVSMSRSLHYKKARFSHTYLTNEELTLFIKTFIGSRVIDLSFQSKFRDGIFRVGPGIAICGGDSKGDLEIFGVLKKAMYKNMMFNFLMCLRQRGYPIYWVRDALKLILHLMF